MPRKVIEYDDDDMRELMARLHGVAPTAVFVDVDCSPRGGGKVKFRIENYTKEPGSDDRAPELVAKGKPAPEPAARANGPLDIYGSSGYVPQATD